MYRNLRSRRTIPSLFAQTVKKHPDKPALIYEASGEVGELINDCKTFICHAAIKASCMSACVFEFQVWSFQELQERCHAVAHWALDQGWAEGDVVALYMESQPLVVALWLGLAMIGVEAALINHNLRQRPFLHCVSVSGARALVFGTEMREGVKNPEFRYRCDSLTHH